jgi:hypothetical protein
VLKWPPITKNTLYLAMIIYSGTQIPAPSPSAA